MDSICSVVENVQNIRKPRLNSHSHAFILSIVYFVYYTPQVKYIIPNGRTTFRNNRPHCENNLAELHAQKYASVIDTWIFSCSLY